MIQKEKMKLSAEQQTERVRERLTTSTFIKRCLSGVLESGEEAADI